MSNIQAAIAATRFSMGARAGEIIDIGNDPRGWLKQQVKAKGSALLMKTGTFSATTLPTTIQAAKTLIDGNTENKAMRMASKDADDIRDAKRDFYRRARLQHQLEITIRNHHGINTPNGFSERWVRFWSNHFSVATRQRNLVPLVGPFEREAIRPHAFGRFEDMLQAAVLHQAMLVYLDNYKSVGPQSRVGQRRDRGLNENLAREVLELHTLGVDGGYSQADVLAFAKTLTGWTVKGLGPGTGPVKAQSGNVVFAQRIHEPGTQIILGASYKDTGATQAPAVLSDLSVHKSTAKHIAFKLARHFIADTPPAKAVDQLAAVFTKTGGDLRSIALAVIGLEDAWSESQLKFKSPEELLISSARMLGRNVVFRKRARGSYNALGQTPFTASSPKGWPDIAADWAGPDAIKKRLEWANDVARRTPADMSGVRFLEGTMGDLVSSRTRQTVERAESPAQAFTLALMSPEFQRR